MAKLFFSALTPAPAWQFALPKKPLRSCMQSAWSPAICLTRHKLMPNPL